MPTVADLRSAYRTFRTNESRQRYYDQASMEVASALETASVRDLRAGLWTLLSTWNAQYYRFRPPTPAHFVAIEELLSRTWAGFSVLRHRSLEDLIEHDLLVLQALFRQFCKVLGPVGAAKTLHLLAPRAFAIWDRKIAKAYGLYLPGGEKNTRDYLRFLRITQQQVRNVGGEKILERNPLKAVDEYNYCRFTTKWFVASAEKAVV